LVIEEVGGVYEGGRREGRLGCFCSEQFILALLETLADEVIEVEKVEGKGNVEVVGGNRNDDE
jgi:hypothetical protein